MCRYTALRLHQYDREMLKVLTSKIDNTTNVIYPDGSEFRCVEREDNTTAYLSSHTGCSLGCRMCHLTATGDTKMIPLSSHDMFTRALTALMSTKESTKPLNFSFMAKGDALANKAIDGDLVRTLLTEGDRQRRQHTKVVISTIFPTATVGWPIDEYLFDHFGSFQPHIYWSLYSLDKEFREYWLPRSADPVVVAEGLARWQKRTCQEIVIHHALIDGRTDDGTRSVPSNFWAHQATDIRQLLEAHNIHYRVNLVRYNPPENTENAFYGKEPSERCYSDNHLALYRLSKNCTSAKIQERVGYDVKASCGMFLPVEAATNV